MRRRGGGLESRWGRGRSRSCPACGGARRQSTAVVRDSRAGPSRWPLIGGARFIGGDEARAANQGRSCASVCERVARAPGCDGACPARRPLLPLKRGLKEGCSSCRQSASGPLEWLEGAGQDRRGRRAHSMAGGAGCDPAARAGTGPSRLAAVFPR